MLNHYAGVTFADSCHKGLLHVLLACLSSLQALAEPDSDWMGQEPDHGQFAMFIADLEKYCGSLAAHLRSRTFLARLWGRKQFEWCLAVGITK